MLTGQAKKEYQKKYMKEYMRNRRLGIVKTQTKGVTITPEPLRPVKTQALRPVTITPTEPVSQQPVTDVLSDLRAKAQAIIDQPPDKVVEIPVYNRSVHHPGDMVLVKGRVAMVEETDAEGNVIPEY